MRTSRVITVFLHLIFWVLLILVITLLLKSHPGDKPRFRSPGTAPAFTGRSTLLFSLPEFMTYLVHIGFFYLNALLLVPRLLSAKKYTRYLLCILGIVTGVCLLNLGIICFAHPVLRSFTRVLGIQLFVSLFIVGASTSYRVVRDTSETEKRQKEKENETLKTELSFLRSQVSPHFMFNVLNSTVSLARKKSDRLEPVLIELSNLMRYMLYESDEEKVSVDREMEYLQSYINLQTLRFGDDVQVKLEVHSKTTKALSIEPMLLIPLVENAFKHGIGLIEKPEINIQVNIAEEEVNARVTNRFNRNSREEKDKNSGIGLSNLKRRLNLLYPEKHELLISENNGWFIVSLQLSLT